MFIMEKMDFDRVKKTIDPVYLSSLEFLESLQVATTMLDEAPLAFQFGQLMQNWTLNVANKDNCDFSIICNKENQRIDIECLTTHTNMVQLAGSGSTHDFYNYFESKYGVKINRATSNVQDNPMNFKFFCYFEFEELPTIEQISQIYHDLFFYKGAK